MDSYPSFPVTEVDGSFGPEHTEDTPFTITVRFAEGISERHMEAFKRAADRWTRIIKGAVSPVMVDGELIEGVLILAEVIPIDGPARVLGQGGPTFLRPETAARGRLLPAKGEMQFDKDDLDRLERRGRLHDVIAHEMGHVLGIGTAWYGSVDDLGGTNPTFRGPSAMREYARLRDSPGVPTAVPLENDGRAGSDGAHWRESIVANELMSGRLFGSHNPLSRLTVACLEDLGYEVDYDAAESYSLPSLLEAAERGRAALVDGRLCREHVLPLIPSVLPNTALVIR